MGGLSFGCRQRPVAKSGLPLDDTYIHLTLPKTLASAGVWGIDPSDAGGSFVFPPGHSLAAPYAPVGRRGGLMLYAPLGAEHAVFSLG